MKHNLIIWGASGHALVVADIIRLQGQYRISRFIDNINPERSGAEFCGSYIVGGQEQLELIQQQEIKHMILGFGNCRARLRISDLVRAKGFSLATAIHPQAVIAEDVTIGDGTVIVAGAVINSEAKIGENVIVNTCASIDHECIVEDGAHICPGVHLAGRVTVGRASWVGIGSTISDRVRIGTNTLIGAGSVVVSDIPDGVVAYGVPARVMRRNTSNE